MAIDKIGSKALTDSSVVAADIAPGTVTTTQLAGSITNAKLANSNVTVNGTSINLGASGSIPAVSWQSVVTSDGSTVTTMVAGNGYFVNNTSAAGLVKLPISASAGDTIAIKDYAGNFGTNSLTIQRNGHNIQGVANDSEISTDRASLTLVYVDATKGWLYAVESNVAYFGPAFISATGGTVTTSGDFKIHTFTGDGNFVVSCGGNPAGSDTVSYLVVAGGGEGGSTAPSNGGGGGGAGGYREGYTPGTYTASPLAASALPISATTYPVTVGGGGAQQCNPANNMGNAGSNSIFSTITSAGGGGGKYDGSANPAAQSGGSGGGGSAGPSIRRPGGSGNTPPTTPAQGTDGGTGGPNSDGTHGGGGGGGATGAGGNVNPGTAAGTGGVGATTNITGSPVAYAGGGGAAATAGGASSRGAASPCGTGGQGGSSPNLDGSAGTINRGGGGGSGGWPAVGTARGGGGKGIVIIRYKFQ